MASTEETPEPLKYQTWVLRVSIHCEGCKKKVKKVLQGIDGVYKITTGSQQQKVMVTGNVAAETLIKKLGKTGKHAELWPEPKPAANPDSTSDNNGGGSGGKKKKNTNNNNRNKPNEPSEHPKTEGPESGNGTASAAKSDTEPAEESPKPDKKDSEGGKRKGKKGNGGGDCGGGGSGGEALAEEEDGQKAEVAAAATEMSPVPCQHVYHYPMYQVPATGPRTARSYYIPLAAAAAAATTASYDIFSEENANACTVM
ncbi:putative glycine-rich cell wall structural protein 1.0 [Iris pallida]|uniref:Glycine-rich cell wall structural protein 1.0 n=1 Tax=Iris pallida TaxID=29817 RepID=A0AAX6GNK3_IRIPA|nr:putative glycine-rich cell wall structural protein 1.0 [Iris pallida]